MEVQKENCGNVEDRVLISASARGFTEYICRDLKEDHEFASWTSQGKHSGQKEQYMQKSERVRGLSMSENMIGQSF